jgi:hypothetical protein
MDLERADAGDDVDHAGQAALQLGHQGVDANAQLDIE